MENRYTEIFKLDAMLSKAGIPHDIIETGGTIIAAEGYQIHLYADEAHTIEIDDCICHSFSHGWEEGLLETYRFGDCCGYETADEVFTGWVRMYAKRQKGDTKDENER